MSDASRVKATRVTLSDFSTPQMRAFHLTWMAFFVCFFAWFACAPLMPVIKGEFGLTKDQIANINIAAVAVTILVRVLIGPLCDRLGPRKAYTGLLLIGAIPVFGVAASQSYESFLFFRLLIGAIGASFVITQYHTSVMFAPNVVGTANAAAAGWGNAGGGATQAIMPLILAAVLTLGAESAFGWRIALLVPGVLMVVMGVLYWKYTQDCPAGNYDTLRATGLMVDGGKKASWISFKKAATNYRVWMLFVTYAACFGVEIFIHNIAALYYVDRFELSLKQAGFAVGAFGLLALFARALGGMASDRIARTRGLDGRTLLLFALIVGEGLGLLWFAQMDSVAIAIVAMIVFGLFTHMACGATYALVPFIDRNALGGVAGIIGAGGNVGAVAAGFLMKGSASAQECLLILGVLVTASAVCAIAVRFSSEHKTREQALYEQAVSERSGLAA
ncbi:MFS transporter [Panacagrimonas sp.]|uniref:MFS transporter n=1 Tax=Panacagrimonas sp. TaxID=2480088 RepID=UPI003B520C62